LSGLIPNQTYGITIYSWDTFSTEIRITDWTANGEYLLTTIHDGNVDPPAAEDDYAFTGMATSDDTGVIFMEAVPGEGTFAAEPFGFINALAIAATMPIEPEPVITVNPIETMEATGDFGDILSINGIEVGDLIVGTTTFPDPPASEPQPAENADNFSLATAACADNQPYMQTIFGQAVTTIFIFEKSGNDNGSMQALDAMGNPVGNAVVFSPDNFAGTAYMGYGDQVAFGTVITSDVPIYGVVLTASRLPEEGGLGIDPFCICAIPEP